MNEKTAPPVEPGLHAPRPDSSNPQTDPSSPQMPGSAIDQILSGELEYSSDSAPLIKQAIGNTGFELAIVYLEEIVKKIEENPGNLDRNTQLYAVGELLRQHCDRTLKMAEAKVEQIIKDTQGETTWTEPLNLP